VCEIESNASTLQSSFGSLLPSVPVPVDEQVRRMQFAVAAEVFRGRQPPGKHLRPSRSAFSVLDELSPKKILGTNKQAVARGLPFGEEINEDIIATLMNC
jgi:hypothetical protein